MQAGPRRLERIERWFAKPGSHRVTTALALLLCAPALTTGLALDDYVLAVLSRADSGIAGLKASALWLFTFTTGDPATNTALMDEGVLLPWWSDPEHLNAFFRPLSSLSHVLDFGLWPDWPSLMHLHSLLWLAALIGVVAHVYRTLQVGPAWAAGLATFAFAMDDAHGMTVAWIANRNALIALTLALPALSAHHRLRSEGFRAGRWAAPGCLALGLCAGETALCVVAYLGAYALCEERGSLVSRLRTLLPYVGVVLVWRVAYVALGLGSAGSGAYHDPGREPLRFAEALLEHLPVLLGSQLALPLADLAFWGGQGARLACWLGSLLGCAVVGVLLWPRLRSSRRSRMWAVGMLACAVLVSASVPGMRLLLGVSVGAGPLVADAYAEWRSAQGLRRSALAAFVAWHLVAAPLGLPGATLQMALLGGHVARAEQSLSDVGPLTDKTVVVVNPPADVMVSYLQLMRQARDASRPAHLYWLATSSSALRVRRDSEHSLRVEPEDGFLSTRPERHYRGEQRPLQAHQRIELSAMVVTTGELGADGRPQSAVFDFGKPLPSAELIFVQYEAGRFRPFELPAVGAEVALPARGLLQALSEQLQ